ncbi:MAG: metalloregulator ArsR/SmtB family transcription factor [Candidatus Promineifilaceae bacterium]
MDKFDALADANRRKIIEILAKHGELPASDIYEHFDVSPQAVSQHLKVLRQAKLVRVEKRAQQRIYQINSAAMLELEEWARQLRQLWDQRFDALDKLLQRELNKENKNEQE